MRKVFDLLLQKIVVVKIKKMKDVTENHDRYCLLIEGSYLPGGHHLMMIDVVSVLEPFVTVKPYVVQKSIVVTTSSMRIV